MVVSIATAVMVIGVPRFVAVGASAKSNLLGFLLFFVCDIVIAIAMAPVLSQYTAGMFVDFIYSTHGTTAETDINDPVIYAQSQNVFSLLRTISFLVLAAALYGFFWAVPILRQWPSASELISIPPHMVPAFVVMILSTLVWFFYLSVYFIPSVCQRFSDWWNR